MDLNETAVFVRVVQAGSFSAAARQLGLPTSTVSTRVARLERRLWVTLLQRTTRRLHLTDLGELYFRHAEAGLANLLDAEAALTESVGEPKGRLRVTAPADLGDRLLSGIVCRMRRACPQVALELVLTSQYVDLVGEGIDVAIRAGALKDSSLIARNVGVARWQLFASPDYLAGAPELVAPQALRLAVPSLANSLISLIKDTSLVSVITVSELMMTTKDLIAQTFQPLPLYLMAAAIYWVLSALFEQVQKRVENKLHRAYQR